MRFLDNLHETIFHGYLGRLNVYRAPRLLPVLYVLASLKKAGVEEYFWEDTVDFMPMIGVSMLWKTRDQSLLFLAVLLYYDFPLFEYMDLMGDDMILHFVYRSAIRAKHDVVNRSYRPLAQPQSTR